MLRVPGAGLSSAVTSKAWNGRLLGFAAISICLALGQIGCNSAMFQTAEVIEGASATIGLTKVEDGEATEVSDYSVFFKGSVGRQASRAHPGYEIGLTFLAPLRNKRKQAMSPDEARVGTFPNQWAGVFPEFKMQLPKRLPIDFALDLRLMTYLPERIALIASKDLSEWLTLYGCYGYAASIGGVANTGSELRIHPRISIYLEYTRWLNTHHYPEGYNGSPLDHPFSMGVALRYLAPSKPKPIDPRAAMAKRTADR